MIRAIRWTATGALVFTLCTPAFASAFSSNQASTRTYKLPFDRLAGDFLGSVGSDEVDPNSVELQDLLTQEFLRAQVGVFDVRYPLEALESEEHGREFAEVVRGLVQLHEVWLGWTHGDDKLPKELRTAFADLDKWLKGWNGDLSSEQLASGQDLWTLLGPDEDEALALETVRDALFAERFGEGLDPEGTQLVLCPDRRSFLQFIGIVGASRPEMKQYIWKDEVRTWTEFWISFPKDVQILALEYADTRGDMFAGSGMNQREQTGMVQHVVQRATFSLAWFYFGRDLDPVFEAGLAQNMAIAVCGENNARSGGSGRASETQAREVFVPGGLPQGGVLPAWNADSRWRDRLGKDYFVSVLKAAQKDGYRSAGRKAGKLPNFELLSDDQSRTHVVRAPFLGTPGDSQEAAPKSFTADYLEFFRGYKSAFVHWLSEEAAGRRESGAKWGELLTALASKPADKDFESVVEEVYGLPLSAADDEVESLEWAFLEWLSKQR